jgi:hypothetical protein
MKPLVWLGAVFCIVIAPAHARAAPPVEAAGSAASAAAAAAVPAVPRRAKVSCAQIRDTAQATSGHAVFDTRLKPKSWGRIPPGLRKLPRRAKLCGADGMGQVVIASPLFGKELEQHYAPLFEKLEFRSLSCEITDGQTRCSAKRHRDVGVLVTDTTNEAFVLSLIVRSPAAPRKGH